MVTFGPFETTRFGFWAEEGRYFLRGNCVKGSGEVVDGKSFEECRVGPEPVRRMKQTGDRPAMFQEVSRKKAESARDPRGRAERPWPDSAVEANQLV